MAVSTSCRRRRARARACAHRPPAASGRPQWSPELAAARQPLAIAAVAHELHGDPGAAGEGAGYPLALPGRSGAGGGSHSASVPARRGLTAEEFFDVGARERIAAFFRLAPPARDEPRQAAVTCAVARDDHQAQPALERNSAPMLCSLMPPIFFAAECARTTPASEHSSVMASAS